MDGDKMISLFGLYFKTMLSKLETATAAVNKSGILAVNLKPNEWKVGIVQTPYANGASSIYFKEKLNLEIFFSANGVKNLHPNAHKYDIGIYCESNGHGTFLVHQNRLDELEAIGEINETEIEGTPEAKAILADFLLQVRLLAKFIRIQNQVKYMLFFCIFLISNCIISHISPLVIRSLTCSALKPLWQLLR